MMGCGCINNTEGFGYFPIHTVRDGGNDYYMVWRREQQKLYLANTTSENPQSVKQADLLPLDLVLNDQNNNGREDHLNITQVYPNLIKNGVIAVTGHGVILDICDESIRRSTTFTFVPNPCIFLNHPDYTLDTDYRLVGFNRGEVDGWHLDAVAMEERIAAELERYPERVKGNSPAVLPVISFPNLGMAAGHSATDVYKMARAYNNASCPVREHSWFIRGINRIYGYDGNLTMLGYDTNSMRLFASDMNKQVVTVRMSPHEGNSSEVPCPLPEIFNPYQPRYQSLGFRSGVVWGTDEQGRIFQLSQTSQALMGLDLRNRTDASGPRPTITELNRRIEALVPGLLNGVGTLPNTTVGSQLFIVLPSNWSGYQSWYRTSQSPTADAGVYSFSGTDLVSFLGSTLRNTWNRLTENLYWFFSSGTGQLYRQQANNQYPAGIFSDVRTYGADASLIMMGTGNNDSFDSITLGKRSNSNVLYMEGQEGHNTYQVSRGALHHYGMIVIDGSVLRLKDFNHTARSPVTANQVNVAALAHEFIASLGEQSLLLYHHLDHCYLSLPGAFKQDAFKRGPNNITTVVNDTINGTRPEDYGSKNYGWQATPVTLLFNGLEISSQQILGQLLRQPPGSHWPLPLDIDRLTDNQAIVLDREYLARLRLGHHRMVGFSHGPGFIPDSGNLFNLVFTEGRPGDPEALTRNIRFIINSNQLGTTSSLWVNNDRLGHEYIPLELADINNPARHFDIHPILEEDQSPSRVAAVAITPRAHGWEIQADHIRISNLTEPILGHLASQRKFTLLSVDAAGVNSTDSVYGYQEFDRESSAESDMEGGESEGFGCFVVDRSAEGLFFVLDRLPYDKMSTETVPNHSGSTDHRPEYKVYVHENEVPECLVAFRGIPQGVVFAYEPDLQGYPLANGKRFAKAHSQNWLHGPHWLLPVKNPYLKRAGEVAEPDGHPVYYSAFPERLNVKFETSPILGAGQEKTWSIADHGQIARYITPGNSLQPGYLALTLVDRNYEGTVYDAGLYLALPDRYSDLTLQTPLRRDQPFVLKFPAAETVSIEQVISYETGFLPEREVARQLLPQPLGQYRGIYFSDGLVTLPALSQWLSSQPMTIVKTETRGVSQWSATGNALDNVIPVQLKTFGQYTVHGEEGNDLILVNGSNRVSQFNFPVTWSSNITGARDVVVEGDTASLTELAIQATPVVTRPPSPVGYEMDINPGPGNDVIDLNGAANVRLQESEGQDSWILQHFGFADLKALRNGKLFLKDIYSTEVQPVLYSAEFNITVDTLADATEVYLWSTRLDPGRYIARLSLDSVTEIHFADGKQVTDVTSWYEHQTDVESYKAKDSYNSGSAGSAESGSGSGEIEVTPLLEEGVVESLEDTLEDAYTYALVSRDEPVAGGNTAFNGLDQTLALLIQAMSTFRVQGENGVSPSMTTMMASPVPTRVMPAHSSYFQLTASSIPSP